MIRLKLDENFPPDTVHIFREHDIDASSVYEQDMCGYPDTEVFKICKDEKRALITFDLDFANIIRYPASETNGVIIVRSKKKINLEEITHICHKLVQLLLQNDLKGKLFIVEDTKIRVRKTEE